MLGLGPLVRPDMALFSAAFLTVELALRRSDLPAAARTIGTAIAVPAGYQLFRMAYSFPTTSRAPI